MILDRRHRTVLGQLQYGESTGLQVVDRIVAERSTARFYRRWVGFWCYPVLRDLEQLGLVESREGPPDEVPMRGGRPRRYYRMTDKGVKVLASS